MYKSDLFLVVLATIFFSSLGFYTLNFKNDVKRVPLGFHLCNQNPLLSWLHCKKDNSMAISRISVRCCVGLSLPHNPDYVIYQLPQ